MSARPSNPTLIGMFLWATVFTGLLLWLITALWDSAPGIATSDSSAKEHIAISLIAIFGALGGYIRWMHWLSQSVGKSSDWILWIVESLITPLKGAALAVPFILLLRAGVVNSSQGGADHSVNWIGLYAIAGVVGLFAPEAIERLERVFKSLFGLESSEK